MLLLKLKGHNQHWKMRNKKAFEMNFAWIFSIIVGAVILFLAIYTVSQIIRTERYKLDTKTAAKLSILLDPLETSLEAGKSSLIIFNSETRIYNECFDSGSFGKQTISIASKSRLGKEWQKPGGDTSLYNKYIFSDNIEESKEFSVFSKPFNMPFKVSDLIFFSGQEYCVVQSPEEIEDELESLGIKNVHFTDMKSNCSRESKKVCFAQSVGCDIAVYGDNYDFSSGYVTKEGKILHYTDSLIYAALFSSPKVYECNVKRLMLRLISLCLVYKDKIKVLEKRECSSLLDSHLSELISLANALNSSRGLSAVQEKAQEIKRINEAAVCKIYE